MSYKSTRLFPVPFSLPLAPCHSAMHLRWTAAAAFASSILFSQFHGALTSPSELDAFRERRLVESPSELYKRDGSHHHHNGAPLTVLNETQVTMYHAPTPPSYYTIDWDDEGHESRHGGLMILHGIFMSLAFFFALPIGMSGARPSASD